MDTRELHEEVEHVGGVADRLVEVELGAAMAGAVGVRDQVAATALAAANLTAKPF